MTGSSTVPPPTLLCVANYPSNTGYAWDYIEGLYAGLGDRLAERGVRTLVAYPAIAEPPRSLAGHQATPVLLDASLRDASSVRAVTAFVQREGVRVLYLTDRPVWSTAFITLRAAGVRAIVVHDHTSGARTVPLGIKRALKTVLAQLPGINADRVVAVSNYVAQRHVEVGRVPRQRVSTVWNGSPLPDASSLGRGYAHRDLSIDLDRPLIATAARAVPEKGIAYLIRAFAIVAKEWSGPRPALLYVGDGSERGALESLRQSLSVRDDIFFTGYRKDAATLVGSADVAVIPSVWDEACALTVLESMAQAVPVVASRVGGVPDLIDDGVTGILVPRANEAQLAEAILRVMRDPARAKAMGTAARRRVGAFFDPVQQLDFLTLIIGQGFGPADGSDLHH
jgi:glycosyltransferase involved in cell wall biosynthesis